MSLHVDTKNIQSDFAAYCLTGQKVNIPGVKKQGLAQYRRLVRGVFMDALETSFPITRDYLNNETWNKLVDDFMAKHKCQSWQVWNIAGEFYDYSISEKFSENLGLPVLKDLLQFEWAETELYNMKDKEIPAHNLIGDLHMDIPVFNPEFRLFRFEYPVHILKPELAEGKIGEYYLLLFRNLKDGKIHFLDISAWHVWMIEQIAVYSKSLEQTLLTAQSLFENFNEQKFKNNSVGFLNHLQKKNFLLGFKSLNNKN